jgi:hypothetical protein
MTIGTKGLSSASALALLCTFVAGCASGNNNSADAAANDQSRAKTQMGAQMKDAAQTAQAYHAMSNSVLLNNLVEQSKAQVEPFNSPAYRELETRTNVDSKTLLALANENPNVGGLLPLLLLQKLNKRSYLQTPPARRASILTDALRRSKNFNVWGLPNFYLEPAALALIETGSAATPALKRMLGDTRPAPVFGSQEYMIYERLKYRLCDYALFFLEQIGGNSKFNVPASLSDRNALIKQITGT